MERRECGEKEWVESVGKGIKRRGKRDQKEKKKSFLKETANRQKTRTGNRH